MNEDGYLPAMGEDEPPFGVVCYMCKTNWECEIGLASGGNRVYPSVEDLKENCKCWRGCGIVQVRVLFEAVVSKGTDP